VAYFSSTSWGSKNKSFVIINIVGSSNMPFSMAFVFNNIVGSTFILTYVFPFLSLSNVYYNSRVSSPARRATDFLARHSFAKKRPNQPTPGHFFFRIWSHLGRSPSSLVTRHFFLAAHDFFSPVQITQTAEQSADPRRRLNI